MISMGIVERLLRKNEDGSLGEITEADQYEAAERIKELEAERDAERDNCVAIIAAYQEQLSALHQRIADAPVVAWGHFWKIDGEEILQWPVASSAEEAAKDIQMYAEGDREQMSVKPLISKKDLL